MWKRRLLPAIAPVLLLVGHVQAHSIWIERDGAGPARAYFGEWADDIREKAVGALDRIKSPQAFLTSPQRPLIIERRADHLEIAVKGGGDVRLIESGLAPRDDVRAGGKSRTIFYAKAGRAETTGKLDLELVPIVADGATFVLMFRGAPLLKANVTVYGPPKWEKPLRTNDQGQVTVPMPWAGRYVLEVAYVEETGGEINGLKFDRTRHVSTVSFVEQNGLSWSADR
jgi:hypothetical protein